MEPGVFSVTCYVKNGAVTILEFIPFVKMKEQVSQSKNVPPPFFYGNLRWTNRLLKSLPGEKYIKMILWTKCICGGNPDHSGVVSSIIYNKIQRKSAYT